MSISISTDDLNKTIEFIQNQHQRNLKQIITDVQNVEHTDYKNYHRCRARLTQIYNESSARLEGIKFLLIDHKQLVNLIKTADKTLHDEWQLHDFNIVALQRPGTKPPLHFEKAA